MNICQENTTILACPLLSMSMKVYDACHITVSTIVRCIVVYGADSQIIFLTNIFKSLVKYSIYYAFISYSNCFKEAGATNKMNKIFYLGSWVLARLNYNRSNQNKPGIMI